jgi:hypothetical protein
MKDRTPPPDFWLSSGFRLLARDGQGHLAVTDDDNAILVDFG